jgi:hypothetical protein
VKKKSLVEIVIGLLLGCTFIGIAIYLLFFPEISPSGAKQNLRLYVMLTGAYGIWRLIRVWLAWKKAQENV